MASLPYVGGLAVTLNSVNNRITMEAIPEPPAKPSDLIKLALADIDGLDKSVYEIKMDSWHQQADGKCCVCLAGAVIANTLKRPHWQDIFALSSELCDPTYYKWFESLLALDRFRTGNLHGGLGTLRIYPPKGMPSMRELQDEGFDRFQPEQWRSNTEWCLAELLKHDL